MKIKFHSPKELERNLKISIHKSGKMGFTVEAAKKLKLSTGKSAAIGTNEEDLSDDSLYLMMYEGIEDDAFRVSKAGAYYYINTKPLFDALKMDYSKGDMVYDMTEQKIGEDLVYKLKRRGVKKKNTEEETK